VHPTIDRKGVEQQFQAHHPDLARCMRKRNAPPKVSVKLTIEPDGNATQVATDAPDPNMDACIVDVVDKMRFPHPTGGSVALEFPLQLGEIVPADEKPPEPEQRAEITQAVQGIHNQLIECAAKFNVHGKSSLHLDVAADGSVRNANVNGNMAGQPFEACVAAELKKMKLGKQPHATVLNLVVLLR
jgi:hypothetical protein